jgi:RecB family exonuclease
MKVYKYRSVSELHWSLHSRITSQKTKNPLSATVLVVENPLQGLLLRRQLVASSPIKALANIQVKSFDELIAELGLKKLGLDLTFPTDAILDAASYSVMVANPQFGFGQAISLATATGISTVFKTLKFTSDEKLVKLSESAIVSETQKAVILSVIEVRRVIEKNYGFPNYPRAILNLANKLATTGSDDTEYFVISEGIPALLESVFEALQNSVHYNVEIGMENPKLENAQKHFTAPDPQTESVLAVTQVLQLISDGVHPFDIALVYSNEQQYARLLATALDEAGITWHGAADTIAQSSRIYRGFDLILQMLEARNTETSGATRPLLMRLLESGNFSVNNLEVDSDLCRKFVRDKEIYGDAIGWLKILNSLPREGSKSDLKAVDELKALLKSLQKTLHAMSSAQTWGEFGEELFSVVENFFIVGNDKNLTEDELEVVKKFRQVLLEEFPALDKSKPADHPGLLPTAASARAFIARKVGDRNRRNGTLSAGVHLSGIAEVQVLRFHRIVLVGATEGLLPATYSESSFLSDAMLKEIGELGKSVVPTQDKAKSLGANLLALLADTNPVIMRSRSGMLGKLDNIPSRFLDLEVQPFNYPTDIKSFSDLTSEAYSLPLASDSAVELLENDEKTPTASQERALHALKVFRRPEAKGFFGDISGISVEHSLADTHLSASAIETFIDCQYRFFVTKRLGIYTGERGDELSEWRPKDFGNLIHNSMELFLRQLSSEDSLPDGESGFTQKQVNLYFDKYLAEGLEEFYAKGLDVWRSGFENHMERVKSNLRNFFAEEYSKIRATSKLAVHDTEVAFGKGTEIDVKVDTPSGTSISLTGRIDRVDLSDDMKSAGVVDFKSGKYDASKVASELGRPGERAPNVGKVRRKKVQDLVYSIAVPKLYPSVQSVDVNFAYISNGEKTEFANAEWAKDPETKLGAILENIVRAEFKGYYYVSHATAISSHTYCDICLRLGWVAEQLRLEHKELSANNGGDSDD